MCAVRAAVSGCARANLSTGGESGFQRSRARERMRVRSSAIVRIIDASMKEYVPVNYVKIWG